MSNLLKEMSDTIMKEIYNYGNPDGSDYTEYMKTPANSYFEKIKKYIRMLNSHKWDTILFMAIFLFHVEKCLDIDI